MKPRKPRKARRDPEKFFSVCSRIGDSVDFADPVDLTIGKTFEKKLHLLRTDS